jgi:tRNA N6-adenosine threonylcarbamoyltransferase
VQTIRHCFLHSSLTSYFFLSLQALAQEFKKPFVTVHHLEAHCVMARLAGIEVVAEVVAKKIDENETESPSSSAASSGDSRTVSRADSLRADSGAIDDVSPEQVIDVDVDLTSPVGDADTPFQAHFTPKVTYPFLALLASGGHTSILLCHELGEYQILGGTLDDALGEAFDKAARLLGLKCASSGGAAVEAAARGGDKDSFPMTVPMRSKLNCDFSYAGLKNAFRLAVQTAREREGLDVNSTNAPANQMEESPEIVVRTSLPVCLFQCLSVCLFQCLSVCLSVCFSVCLSVCFSVCLSVCFSVSLPAPVFTHSLFVFYCAYLSASVPATSSRRFLDNFSRTLHYFKFSLILYLVTSMTPVNYLRLHFSLSAPIHNHSLSDTIRQCYSRSMRQLPVCSLLARDRSPEARYQLRGGQ